MLLLCCQGQEPEGLRSCWVHWRRADTAGCQTHEPGAQTGELLQTEALHHQLLVVQLGCAARPWAA